MSKRLAGAALLALVALLARAATAETVGVSMARFDDPFLTALREGMEAHAARSAGLALEVEDAQDDAGRQLQQVQTFIAAGVAAMIVNPVDTDASVVISEAAADAGIPLVYVNRQPINVDDLPDGQAFVASDERQSGTLEAEAVCRLLIAAGKGAGARVLVLTGELTNQAARQRTEDIDAVLATDDCRFMSIVEEQPADWQRSLARDAMARWLSAGVAFDALIANNDEMAIGAIEAMKAAGTDMGAVVVAGIDATAAGLAAMRAGELDVTVFQDAAAQGRGAVDAAVRLAHGEAVARKVYVPFRLVTAADLPAFEAGR